MNLELDHNELIMNKHPSTTFAQAWSMAEIKSSAVEV